MRGPQKRPFLLAERGPRFNSAHEKKKRCRDFRYRPPSRSPSREKGSPAWREKGRFRFDAKAGHHLEEGDVRSGPDSQQELCNCPLPGKGTSLSVPRSGVQERDHPRAIYIQKKKGGLPAGAAKPTKRITRANPPGVPSWVRTGLRPSMP